jgi:hypothetical protein
MCYFMQAASELAAVTQHMKYSADTTRQYGTDTKRVCLWSASMAQQYAIRFFCRRSMRSQRLAQQLHRWSRIDRCLCSLRLCRPICSIITRYLEFRRCCGPCELVEFSRHVCAVIQHVKATIGDELLQCKSLLHIITLPTPDESDALSTPRIMQGQFYAKVNE